MFKKLFYWELFGFIFVLSVGTLLHYTYEWSHKNIIIASFSAVNESTWEHLKLLFMPMFIFTIIEYFIIGRNFNNFISAKAIGLLFGLYSILTFVYTYSGMIGKNILFMDISIFVISSLIAYAVSYYIIKHHRFNSAYYKLCGIFIICLILVIFVVFTYYPPHIKLFLDPKTQTYGI